MGLLRLVAGASRRLRHNGLLEPVSYAATRFWAVRRLGQTWARLSRSRGVACESTSLFPDADPARCAATLRQHGYAEGLRLPDSMVDRIRRFAEDAPCTTYTGYGMSGRAVTYQKDERDSAERELGRTVPLARVRGAANRCEQVRQVERDPVIHDIAAEYFGYPVRCVESRLYWSFADGLDRASRASYGQNVFFHYDLEAFCCNYLFFQFYLTEADEKGGPLELLPGTHRAKPLPCLLGSANLSDRAVDRHFGLSNTVAIQGSPGEGFVMDGYCIHRATPPEARDRLFLQVRAM